MSRHYVLLTSTGWHRAAGIVWLVGMLILFGWASPLRGQSVGQPAARSTQAPKNPFWPFGPNGPPPTAANPSSAGAPSAVNKSETGPAGSSPSTRSENPSDPSVAPSETDSSSAAAVDSSGPSSSATSVEKPPPNPSAAEAPTASNGKTLPTTPNRIREGTRIQQQKGIFTIAGDRVIFAAQNKTLPKLVVLENLNLQRVIQTIQGSTQQEMWVVTGRVTEFQGTNYLLLERATRIDEADLEQSPLARPAWISQPTVPPASDKSAAVGAPSAPAAEVVQPAAPSMPSAAQPPLKPTSAGGTPPR